MSNPLRRAAVTVVAIEARPVEDLIADMVLADGATRALAYSEAVRANFTGTLIADYCCGRRDEPALLTLGQLFHHLRRTDNATTVRVRGYRLHTPINVTVWTGELEDGSGPAYGRGPA